MFRFFIYLHDNNFSKDNVSFIFKIVKQRIFEDESRLLVNKMETKNSADSVNANQSRN